MNLLLNFMSWSKKWYTHYGFSTSATVRIAHFQCANAKVCILARGSVMLEFSDNSSLS